MNKNEILQSLSARISTGLTFIEFEYLRRHSSPDSAYIRNIYILLSYYSELLIKAIYIATTETENINVLDEKLKKQAHDLKKIGKEIGAEKLMEYGIFKIDKIGEEYSIRTIGEVFYVKDFTDIRYDFIGNRVRTLEGDEHILFQHQIKIMHQILKRLKKDAWPD